MGIFDSRLFAWLQPQPKPSLKSPRSLAGRRQHIRRRHTTDAHLPASLGGWFIQSPTEANQEWRVQDLDTQTLAALPADELLNLLADISPEISRALWDFLRFCNSGYTVTVTTPAGSAYPRGQAAVDDFLRQLDGLYHTVDVVINRLFLAAFLRGAFFAELVLDERGRLPIDLATPDPVDARFRLRNDAQRGAVWELGQYQAGVWRDLEYPTVAYVPIDPLPGSPYGRPPVSPALFTSIFLIGLLHDLRRVIAQQGYPRLDLTVNLQQLMEAMPADVSSDQFREWVEETIDEVQDVYNGLEPDDAYVHTDVVTVGRPVGTVGNDSLSAVDGIIRALERMITRALKTMPLLMGSNEAVTETHANRQWEIHVAGIRALQHLAENMLGQLMRLALEAQGLQAIVTWRFAELRASESLRDAQTEAVRIANASAKYAAGWISQDEAAQEVTGRDADTPSPRQEPAG